MEFYGTFYVKSQQKRTNSVNKIKIINNYYNYKRLYIINNNCYK